MKFYLEIYHEFLVMQEVFIYVWRTMKSLKLCSHKTRSKFTIRHKNCLTWQLRFTLSPRFAATLVGLTTNRGESVKIIWHNKIVWFDTKCIWSLTILHSNLNDMDKSSFKILFHWPFSITDKIRKGKLIDKIVDFFTNTINIRHFCV